MVGFPPCTDHGEPQARQTGGKPRTHHIHKIAQKNRIPLRTQIQAVETVKQGFKFRLCPVKHQKRDKQDGPGRVVDPDEGAGQDIFGFSPVYKWGMIRYL